MKKLSIAVLNSLIFLASRSLILSGAEGEPSPESQEEGFAQQTQVYAPPEVPGLQEETPTEQPQPGLRLPTAEQAGQEESQVQVITPTTALPPSELPQAQAQPEERRNIETSLTDLTNPSNPWSPGDMAEKQASWSVADTWAYNQLYANINNLTEKDISQLINLLESKQGPIDKFLWTAPRETKSQYLSPSYYDFLINNNNALILANLIGRWYENRAKSSNPPPNAQQNRDNFYNEELKLWAKLGSFAEAIENVFLKSGNYQSYYEGVLRKNVADKITTIAPLFSDYFVENFLINPSIVNKPFFLTSPEAFDIENQVLDSWVNSKLRSVSKENYLKFLIDNPLIAKVKLKEATDINSFLLGSARKSSGNRHYKDNEAEAYGLAFLTDNPSAVIKILDILSPQDFSQANITFLEQLADSWQKNVAPSSLDPKAQAIGAMCSKIAQWYRNQFDQAIAQNKPISDDLITKIEDNYLTAIDYLSAAPGAEETGSYIKALQELQDFTAKRVTSKFDPEEFVNRCN